MPNNNTKSVKTQKTSKRNVKPINSSGSIERMNLVINSKELDLVFNDLPPQLQNILDHVETYGEGSMPVKELNEWWDSAFIQTGIVFQDVPTVISHYRARFRKTYKGYKPEQLAKVFSLTT